MNKNKLNAFTLVELMVVITVILILATFVSLSLVNSKKKARDEKRVMDVNNIAAALDQYALDNKRLYPLPKSCIGENVDTSCPGVPINDPSIESVLRDYLSPFPNDPLNEDGYDYEYRVSKDRQKAAVVVNKFEVQKSLCNLNATTNISTIPKIVQDLAVSNLENCYYVAR